MGLLQFTASPITAGHRRSSSSSGCSPSSSGQPDVSTPSPPSSRFVDTYTLGPAIGTGSFANVYKCYHRVTGMAYAVKIIRISRDSAPTADTTARSAAVEELRICASLEGCPGVLQLHETFELLSPASGSGLVYAVFELAEGGELTRAVDQRGSLPEEDARGVLKSLFQTCAGMHRRGVVHRDIKLDNILLKHTHVFDGGVRLADMGLATTVAEGTRGLRQTCGTPCYMAPEILEVGRQRRDAAAAGVELPSSVGYGEEVDVWSCGVVLFTVLCGFPPFGSEDCRQLFRQILEGGFSFADPAWEMVSSEAKDLVLRCLTRDPADRITSEEALRHPWMMQA